MQNRTGGLIDVQGGYPHSTLYTTLQTAWPVLSCGPAPADTDHDGMTDAYETANGLNPSDAADRQALAANGYTNLENYLNGFTSVITTTRSTTGGVAPLQLYPNPAAGQLTLIHPRATATSRLAVLNFTGQRVATYEPRAGEAETHLSLAALPAGNYLLVYTDNSVQLTAKVVRP